MNHSQYATYPHFRADGWIYFLVRDLKNNRDYVAASDAAIKIQEQYPISKF